MNTLVSNCAGQDSKDGLQTNVCGLSGRKRGVFARPNLKLFALGAIFLLVVQALIPDTQSASTQTLPWLETSGQPMDIDQLLAAARKRPCFELFVLISEHYEKMGDYRRAIDYLRMADEAESSEDL